MNFNLVESPLEKRFLEDCKTVGYYVIPQYKIGKFRADFYDPNKNLVIECDGKEFHKDKLADIKRDDFLFSKGFKIIRLDGSIIHKYGERIAFYLKNCKEDDIEKWRSFASMGELSNDYEREFDKLRGIE